MGPILSAHVDSSAMERRFAGAAEQPTGNIASTETEQSSGSAAQPAKHAPHRSTVPQECRDWLQALPEHVVAQSRPLQRVHSATALLQMPSTREQRQEIQSLLEGWDVPQKHKGRKRKFDLVKTELVSRVVEETGRLKIMHDAARASIPTAPASPAWAKYSAIQAALQKDTARHKG